MEDLIRNMMKIIIKMVCLMMMMMVKMGESKEPVLHYVGGGKYDWLPNVNLSHWSASQLFYQGDWLCKFSFLFFF